MARRCQTPISPDLNREHEAGGAGPCRARRDHLLCQFWYNAGNYQTFSLLLRKKFACEIYFLTNKQTNMAIEQYTYWSITINNPDENDYLITRNPNPKYIREMVWTPEVGAKEGTPHIQGWLRLQRNQTRAFVSKLYPRASIKPCKKDDYVENCHQYAQKNDETTAGPHHITLNDPLPAADTILYKVLDAAWDRLVEKDDSLRDRIQHEGLKGELYCPFINLKMLMTEYVEREMVMERSGLEKIFCSPAYDKMKRKYWREIIFRLKYKQNEEGGSNSSQSSKSEGQQEDTESEDYQDGECQTTTDESASCYSGGGSSHVSQESREQTGW